MSEDNIKDTFAITPQTLKPVGRWILPGSSPTLQTQFYMLSKPKWLHRALMKVLLGWEWKDGAL